MDIVLFGIQGSGKGTQARRLAAEFGFDMFEAGGELRKIAASGSDLGNTVKRYIDAGHLVPHEIIMMVVRDAVSKRSHTTPILFDGVPRDKNQQQDFDKVMAEMGRSFTCAHLTLDPEEGLYRILGRAKVEGRVDDLNEHAIRQRMRIFGEKTMPVIDDYTARGLMTEVRGDLPMEEVYQQLKAALHLESAATPIR